MKLLLSPWPYFAVAAAIGFDYATVNVVGRFTSSLLLRVIDVLPG